MRARWITALRSRGVPTFADPTFWLGAWRLRREPVVPVRLIGVYRNQNARTLGSLLRSFSPDRVALWALDEIAETLRKDTIGTGAGTRPALLNVLREHILHTPATFDGILLVCDDDAVISRRHARLFLRLVRMSALDVAQPSHLYRSHTSWPYVRRQLFSFVRLTGFVEQGPLVAFSPAGASQCFPLREDVGMGWGLESDWARLALRGLRLGIVDAVGVRHLNPVSQAYDRAAAERAGRRALSDAGFQSYGAMQVTFQRWRPTRRAPAWIRDGH